MAGTLDAVRRDVRGFTLIELLVVTFVLGVLAAVAIPSFLSQTAKAADAAAKTNAKRLSGMVEECRLEAKSYKNCDKDGDLNGTPGLDWGNKAGEVRVTHAHDDGYTATAVSHQKTGNKNHVFSIVKDSDGTTRRVCDVPGGTAGGCNSSTW